jgi:GTP-binding protein
MDEEARQKIEADRQARRAARNADDDDFDDDDCDVEVVYAPE